MYSGNGSSFTLSQNMIFIVNGSDINLTKTVLIEPNETINEYNLPLLLGLGILMIILLFYVIKSVIKKDKTQQTERRYDKKDENINEFIGSDTIN